MLGSEIVVCSVPAGQGGGGRMPPGGGGSETHPLIAAGVVACNLQAGGCLGD